MPPSQVVIGSVIRILEGPLAPLPCEECIDVEACGRDEVRSGRSADALMYYI